MLQQERGRFVLGISGPRRKSKYDGDDSGGGGVDSGGKIWQPGAPLRDKSGL